MSAPPNDEGPTVAAAGPQEVAHDVSHHDATTSHDALTFHPLANIFPLLEGNAFAELVADVAAHGVREPVWLYDGQILDGRNRWRAAQVAGVPCPIRYYDGDSPLAFVVSLNLHRRHLSESQRAVIAARLATLPLGANQHASIEAPSQADASELLNVSRSAVQRARIVIDDGAPGLVAAVVAGTVSVSAAADLATLPQDVQAEIVASGPDEVREAAKSIRMPHVAHATGFAEWYTPPEFIEAARVAMGSIDLDPASSAVANATVKAGTFFTAQQDGLKQAWFGCVWLNPPFALSLITRFAAALVTKFEAGQISQACVLVNNATDAGWFRMLVGASSATCFTRGRVHFIDAQGNPGGAPLQGQAIVYFGQQPKVFAKAFRHLGFVFVGRPVPCTVAAVPDLAEAT